MDDDDQSWRGDDDSDSGQDSRRLDWLDGMPHRVFTLLDLVEDGYLIRDAIDILMESDEGDETNG